MLNNSIKLFILVILITLTTPSFANDVDEFNSVTAGFKLTKPSDWHFVTAEQHMDSLRNVRIGDETTQKLLTKYATMPLVVAMKYQEPYEDINPSIKVNIKPLGQLKGANPKQIIGVMVPFLQKTLTNFRLLQKPIDTTVSGLPAAYLKASYSLSVADGRSFPTTSEMWIIPKGDFFFLIGSGTRTDEKTGTRQEVRNIINNIVISK